MRLGTQLMDNPPHWRAVAIPRARAAYQARLASQADEVSALGDRAAEIEARDALAGWSHRLHGTAGSFGLSSVADAAEQLSATLLAGAPAQDVEIHAKRLACCMKNAQSVVE